MAHLPRLLDAVGQRCPIHVVVQRATATPQLRHARSLVVQRPGSHLRRAAELVLIARRLRNHGCRKFFVRISTSAALTLGLAAPFLDLQVYYWQSGQASRLRPAWQLSIRRRLRFELDLLLQRLAMRLAHRFVTGPESMARWYAQHMGTNLCSTVVLYNDVGEVTSALDPATSRKTLRERFGLPPGAPVVVFLGRVSPLKGGHHLPALAAALGTRIPSVRLLVVGQIHLTEVPSETARRAPGVAVFAGPLANAEARLILAGADVFVLPSESEGFPRVVLEAMAVGLPVIAFDVGGVRDIMPPSLHRFIVRPRDVEAMAAAAASLLQDPTLRQQASTAMQAALPPYTTEAVADMFVSRIVREQAAS